MTSASLLAQQGASPDIADLELKSVDPVEFINYVGPHERVDSLAEIMAIGTQLADLTETGRSDYAGKYSVQHLSSAESSPFFDADILSLSPTAGVDHIRNLRHIISGYLQARYRYDVADADTISTFITYYNAYYRQDASYFENKFSPEVNAVLQPDIIGLSTNYADWAGNTQIVIPLSANPVLDQPASPDLDETGQQTVSQFLNEREEDKQQAKDLRQDMLELRQGKLNDDQEVLETKQEDLQQENRETQETLEAVAEATTDDQEEAQAAQQELKEQLQDNQKAQNELGAEQQTIAQRQESLNKEQRTLSAENPPSPPQGQDATAAEEPAGQLPPGSEVILLPVKNRFFQFYAVDGSSLDVSKRSPVNSVRSRQYVANENGYVVVAGEYDITETPIGRENRRRIRLLKLDKILEPTLQGRDDIHADSGVWEHDGELFAFLKNGHLGRFNLDLELQSESNKELLPDMAPQFVGAFVLVGEHKQQFVWLDLVTLQSKEPFTP